MVTMGPSGPIGKPALTPAEHEMNLTTKATSVNWPCTTLPFRKPITSGTPELLAGKCISCSIETRSFDRTVMSDSVTITS